MILGGQNKEYNLDKTFYALWLDYQRDYVIIFKIYWQERESESERFCSTYSCIHWLLLAWALTWNWTCNLAILGLPSNQLSFLALLIIMEKEITIGDCNG